MSAHPLSGIRIIEMASIGPVPFAGMLLADLGAEVVSVAGPAPAGIGADLLSRGKRFVRVDAKADPGREVITRLIAGADAVIEGFRPGVMERLGLGPKEMLAANPKLVYCRMTGWGQDGPLAERAGHDINYVAMAGVLGSIGPVGAPPAVPLNLVGDFGGGGMLLVTGLLAALLEARSGGAGQVIDVAMVDGALLLLTMVQQMQATGAWSHPRGMNLLDGGAPFYRSYACEGGGYLAVGALEPKFFEKLLAVLGLSEEFSVEEQYDRRRWPEMAEVFSARIGSRSRAEWEEAFLGVDACTTPVLDLAELPGHPLHRERGSFVEVDGTLQPRPAPRFTREAPKLRGAKPDTAAILREVGYSEAEIAGLVAAGAVIAE